MELKIDDIVMLNSGGPDMTVIKINDENILCRWVNNENNYIKDIFNIHCLTLINLRLNKSPFNW